MVVKQRFLMRALQVWTLVSCIGAFTPPGAIPQEAPVASTAFLTRFLGSKKNEVDIPALVDEAVANISEDNNIVIEHDSEEEKADDEPKVAEDSQLRLDETIANDELLMTEEEEAEAAFDAEQMRLAIQIAQSGGGERGAASPFPKPVVGAVIVTKDGRILGRGRSDYKQNAVQAAIADAGLVATPLREWVVSWPSSKKLRDDLAECTLYVTLEPSPESRGEVLPPMTQLIEMSRIQRVVIGCADPVTDQSMEGAAALHDAGISVSMGVEQEECERLISSYTDLCKTKLQRMARRQFKATGRPLGFLHCSVVDSDDMDAYARHGNAFGKDFGGKMLSFRDFGAYNIAPPPESIWATDLDEDDLDTEVDDFFKMEFEEEEYQENLAKNPMMPWYEQVDAVVATFPRPGNGPSDDDSVEARMNGLKWLATQGQELPANVERILVMDATDLKDLPMYNEDPNLPRGVDIEAFWKSEGRRPTRVLLRRGDNAQAQAAATAAAKAAEAAAAAAQAALVAVESGEAALAAEAALEQQKAALSATKFIQKELEEAQKLKRGLQDRGVIVEVLDGGEPIDVMKHLGKRHGFNAVMWRAGCWGERGVQSILADAFQWVSAHLAVDAVGGKFWQLMLAERAVQAACGPERKVKVFSEEGDFSLQYCDEDETDSDCVLTVDGKPVRHVRLDCRVALVDDERPREFQLLPTKKLDKHVIEEDAPWFL